MSAKQTVGEMMATIPVVDVEQAKKLFDLWVSCCLCVEATYEWEKLTDIRRLNWIQLAKRIRHGELS